MSDGKLGGFSELDGIDDARKVQARTETSIEIILTSLRSFLNSSIDVITEEFGSEIYYNQILIDYSSQIYRQLSSDLRNIPIDERTLEAFIFTQFTSDYSLEKQIKCGLFSGALAQLLTERNKAQGMRTRIYIDGKGQRFNYLFLGAQMVDEIYVQNLMGCRICDDIQNASRLVGIGLVGDYIFNNLGAKTNGHDNVTGVKEVVALGIKGDNAFIKFNNVKRLVTFGLEGDFNIICTNYNNWLETIFAIHLRGKSVLTRAYADNLVIMDMPNRTDIGKDVYEGNDEGCPKIMRQLYYRNIPQTVSEWLYGIIYGSSESIDGNSQSTAETSRGTSQSACISDSFNDCFSADNLSGQLKNKSQDEIMKIVDEITRYADELSERLLMK